MYDPGEEVTRNAEAATVTNSVYNWSPWTVCHGGGWNMEEAGGYLQYSKAPDGVSSSFLGKDSF